MSRAYDIIIVGSGSAGLTSAAIATSRGLNTLIIEKQATLGGTTMLSGGNIWVPNHTISKGYRVEIKDTVDEAKTYLEAAVGSDQSGHIKATEPNRNEYLNKAPCMVSYLQEKGFKWLPSDFPDYQPNLAGALRAGGRTLNPDIFDVELLGGWREYLDLSLPGPNVLSFESFRETTRPRTTAQSSREDDFDSALVNGLTGSLVSMGRSLIAQLLHICMSQSGSDQSSGRITIWTETALTGLLLENGKVLGVKLQKEDEKVEVRSHAVFLAVAGFAHNQAMRRYFLPQPSNVDWTLARPGGDEGEVLSLMLPMAKTSLLRETWGIPIMTDPMNGKTVPVMFEISKPHSIVIDHEGLRFCNEARPYGDYVHSVYETDDPNTRVPAWLILDSAYLRKYTLGSLLPWEKENLKKAVENRYLKISPSLSKLAENLNVNPSGLINTVGEWNEMCKTGKDYKYGRGEDEYQRFIGDESMKPNPNMGDITTPPFYAVQVFPGDAGSKGGLLTDEKGRVLHKEDGVIDGLYASGNITAWPFGKASIGAGTTIGPAMTFAYAAVEHLCQLKFHGTHF